jgi:hypothetical protein
MPTVPAESVLPGRRRRPVIRRAEPVRHVPGAAHLGATPVVETVLDVRRRWRSTVAARPARSTRPVRSGTARTAGTTRLMSSTRSARPARSTRLMSPTRSTGAARGARTARSTGAMATGGTRTAGATRPMSSTRSPWPTRTSSTGPARPTRRGGTRTTGATRPMSSTRSPWPTRTRSAGAGPRARTRSRTAGPPGSTRSGWGVSDRPETGVSRRRLQRSGTGNPRTDCQSRHAKGCRERRACHALHIHTCQSLPSLKNNDIWRLRRLGDALRDKSRQSRMVCSAPAADRLS